MMRPVRAMASGAIHLTGVEPEPIVVMNIPCMGGVDSVRTACGAVIGGNGWIVMQVEPDSSHVCVRCRRLAQ